MDILSLAVEACAAVCADYVVTPSGIYEMRIHQDGSGWWVAADVLVTASLPKSAA